MEIKEEFWNPQKGDTIKGVYIKHISNAGRYNNNLYKIQVADYEIKLIWSSSKLNDLMQHVEIGDKLSIQYNGKRQQENSEIKQYTVDVLEND